MIQCIQIDDKGRCGAVLAPVLFELFADDPAQEHRRACMGCQTEAEGVEAVPFALGQLRVQTVIALVPEGVGLGAALESAGGWRRRVVRVGQCPALLTELTLADARKCPELSFF